MSSGPKNVTSNSTSQSQSTLVPNQAAQPMYGWMAGLGQQLMQTPIQYFPGQGYVSPSAATQQGVGQMMQGAQAMQPYLGQQGQNYNFLSNAADIPNNPYVQGMMNQNAQNVNRQLSESWLPAINRGAQQVNALGSDRQGIAQGLASGRAADALSAANAQTQLTAYGQGLGAQTQALGQTGNMLQNLMAPGMAQLGAGQAVEGYQQKALEDQMARFQYQYNEPWMRAQNIAGLMGALAPTGIEYGSGQGSGTQPNPNYMSPMQTAIGLGTMASGFFSDRRLKRNVRRIGKTGAGYPIYSFDYTWGTPGIGVMADEVPAEWTLTHSSGFKMVDYSKVR